MSIDEHRSGPPGRTGAVLVALVLSLLWGLVPGFGLIDLDTAAPPGDPTFAGDWMLEGSWGALVTALVVVPLLVVALSPGRAIDVAKQLAALAACCAVAAVGCLNAGFLALPISLVLTAAALWPWRHIPASAGSGGGATRWWPPVLVVATYIGLPLVLFGPGGLEVKSFGILTGLLALVAGLAYIGPARRGVVGSTISWPLLLMTGAAAGPWLGYALGMVRAYHDGMRYSGLVDRIPAQVVLGLAVVLLPVLAALGYLPSRLPVWTAAATAALFGWFAVLYPELRGSPGAFWGTAALVWSVALVLVAEIAPNRPPSKADANGA